MGNTFGHQLCVQLGLANFRHRDVRGNAHQLADFTAQALDIFTFFADHNAGSRGVDRNARGLGRTLYLNPADCRLRETLLQILSNLEIRVQQFCIVAFFREPG